MVSPNPSSSAMPRLQRFGRPYQQFDKDKIQKSIRLMECFEVPPKRTIFGSKNSEHWDSFQSKYCSSFHSNFDQDQHYLYALRNRCENYDNCVQPPQVGRRAHERNKSWIVWLLLGCRKSLSTTKRGTKNESDFQWHQDGRGCAINEIHGNKSSSLAERYSDYFERRRFR